jgi:hypothetical protein
MAAAVHTWLQQEGRLVINMPRFDTWAIRQLPRYTTCSTAAAVMHSLADSAAWDAAVCYFSCRRKLQPKELARVFQQYK